MAVLWYRIVQFVFSILFRILFQLQVIGKENIPKTGAVVIACNHVSLLDPPMVGTASSRPVHFMAKSELFVPVLGTLYQSLGAFPVHRGAADPQAIRTALTLLKQKKCWGFSLKAHAAKMENWGKRSRAHWRLPSKAKLQLYQPAF